LGTFAICKKLPQSKQLPNGENSPNLATLVWKSIGFEIDRFRVFYGGVQP
jgi:hypothetical protein